MRKLLPLLVVLLAACSGVREKQILVFYPSDVPEINQKLSAILNVGSEKFIQIDTTARLEQLNEQRLWEYSHRGYR